MSHYTSLSKEHKKENGVFYTPEFLADYTAQKLLYYINEDKGVDSPLTALDPACGNGVLLSSLCKAATDFEAKSIRYCGVDMDPNSVRECDVNLSSKIKKSDYKLLTADSIQPYSFNYNIGWSNIQQNLKVNNGFDLAISNPPWGAELNGYSKKSLNADFNLATGQFDIYNLFIEIILGQLKVGGFYAFILPDSIFSQEQWRLRQLLLQSTEMKLIARLGEKIFKNVNRACTILIGKKVAPSANNVIDCYRLTPSHRKRILNSSASLGSIEKELLHIVAQNRFCTNPKYLFDIDCRDSETELVSKLQATSTTFANVVDNSRGAEISKKGIVVSCHYCNLYSPYPRSKVPKCSHCGTSLVLDELHPNKIIFSHNGNGSKKLKVGEDLSRYFSINKRWIDITKQGINYKDINLYNGPKILVRKTGVGITASLDYDNAITNQVVYILKLKESFKEVLSIEFVLGVLNSRVITYYLLKKYGEVEWRSHPYLTQGILIDLPFPKITKDQAFKTAMRRITRLVKKELNSNRIELSSATDAKIELEVAKLFALNKEDYQLIFDQLKSAEQLIPIKRLLNIGIKSIFRENGI